MTQEEGANTGAGFLFAQPSSPAVRAMIVLPREGFGRPCLS